MTRHFLLPTTRKGVLFFFLVAAYAVQFLTPADVVLVEILHIIFMGFQSAAFLPVHLLGLVLPVAAVKHVVAVVYGYFVAAWLGSLSGRALRVAVSGVATLGVLLVAGIFLHIGLFGYQDIAGDSSSVLVGLVFLVGGVLLGVFTYRLHRKPAT